ncbi:alpha/beta hydrolase [Amycolatopsis sp. WAC 01376]|uniref:alpha/beta fold hydrolase n=1 Tax=Amycolatopsis sp. WAC 01376 TaxID=2203195 RepID=UPI000F7A0C0D|nr:alpha/beta hydrolase [Amycolatopsis sp. WAC 01376]RSM53150.1 alpha/beta hydrolase [Amycolatopsis sp. WAC 01376]
MALEARTLTLHGREIRLREYLPSTKDAEGEPLVLLHGISGSGETWAPLLDHFERTGFGRRVLVPDLPGHGDSAAPRADYGLGAMASVVRDVLALTRNRHATIVGHSLGGGIAMQFAYQFPEMCARLVLVGSAGLGPQVTPVLRATALPGANATLTLAVNPLTVAIARGLAAAGRSLGGRFSAETRELTRHLASLADPGRRRAFLFIARSLIDLRGQRASAIDKLYLAREVPTLVVWGAHDPLIPVTHGRKTAEVLPDSRLTVFENAKHFPHVADPARFGGELERFLTETAPARLTLDVVVEVLIRASEAAEEPENAPEKLSSGRHLRPA